MNIFKKILKITGWFLVISSIGLYCAFYFFTSPKADEKVASEFQNSIVKPTLSIEKFKGFECFKKGYTWILFLQIIER